TPLRAAAEERHGRRHPSLVSNVVTTLLARTATLLLALVSSVLLARMLGPEGRGVFALVLLLPDLATQLGDLGFTQANSVLAGLEPKRRPALVWHSAVIAAVGGGGIAVAGILALVLGVLGLDHLIRAPVWLYMVPMAFVPIAIVAEYWGEILRGMNRIR